MASAAEEVTVPARRSEDEASAPVRRRGTDVVQISSRRFGDFEVPTDRVLHFAQGMIGFPKARRFVILDHRPGSPFKWMLCLEQPDVGFAVVEPARMVPDYVAPLALAARTLGADPANVALFVIVTIPSDPFAMTVNLMAPVVVDLRTRKSVQLVLEDGRCDPSYRVCVPRPAVAAES